MSPTRALQSPVFLFYVSLATGVLLLAGVTLAVLTWGLRKNVGHAWNAYYGWLLIVPVLLLVFFLGRETGIVFVTLVAVLGFHEFARATGLDHDRIITGIVYLGISAMGVVCLMTDPTDGGPGWYGLFMALPAFVTAVIVVVRVS